VEAADTDADRIAAVLSQHNAVDIDKRAAEWETAGWQRKYTTAGGSVDARTRAQERDIAADPMSPRRTTSARIYNPK
jgi:hypothetical protein